MSEPIRVRVDASPPLFAELVRHALSGAGVDADGTAADAAVSVVTADHLAGTSSRIVIVLHDDAEAALTVVLDGRSLPAQHVTIEDIRDLVIDLAAASPPGGDRTTDQQH